MRLVNFCISNNRAVFVLFVFLLMSGLDAYIRTSKEAFPDVSLPMAIIKVELFGASADYCDRLLLRPIAREASGIVGLRKINSYAMDNACYAVLEFDSNISIDKALNDTRARVNNVRGSLPREVRKLTVEEVNFSFFPMLNVVIRSSSMPYRALMTLAENMKDEIKAIAGVLDVNIVGKREEVINVLIKPEIISGYQISTRQIIEGIYRFNNFQALGNIDQDQGEFSIHMETKITNIKDLMDMPIKGYEGGALYVRDLMDIRKTYRDPTSSARVDGQDALVLEISKNSGFDVMQVTKAVKQLIDSKRQFLSENVSIGYSQDGSESVRNSLRNLENSILISMAVVLCLIAFFSNWASASLVAMAIPSSFFAGILAISLLGYTINTIVLFSLMLSVGILVDSALVVVEHADHLMYLNHTPQQAFRQSAIKMFTPVLASTLTTQVVFLPLLFWPGVTGQFLKYLPATVLFVMGSSFVMAIYFLPTIGASLGKLWRKSNPGYMRSVLAIEKCQIESFDRLTRQYHKCLIAVLERPKRFVYQLLFFSASVVISFILLGKGVEFFPDIEPDNVAVLIKARGNLSFSEKTEIMRQVEGALSTDEVRVLYSRLGSKRNLDDIDKDTIGSMFLELIPWDKRRKADAILLEVAKKLHAIPGLRFEAVKSAVGPPKSSDVQIVLTSNIDMDALLNAGNKVMAAMDDVGGFTDIKNNLSTGMVKFIVDVDNERASLMGVDRQHIAEAVSMAAGGLNLGKYSSPDDKDDMDIMLRYSNRNMQELSRITMTNLGGIQVALSEFATLKAEAANQIERVNEVRALKINANVAKGLLVNNQIDALSAVLKGNWDPRIKFAFEGERKDMVETRAFLIRAFGIALCGIFVILLLTFNSVQRALLVMTAVLFSIIGVLLGILLAHSAFGIVMCGIGIITLAGISVNNNILIIDMYEHNRSNGCNYIEAIVRAAISRLRPILLTTSTTALGLMPMVLRLNIDLIGGDINYNSPQGQFWTQISSAIAGGILFSTVIALFFTPAVLAIMDKGEKI